MENDHYISEGSKDQVHDNKQNSFLDNIPQFGNRPFTQDLSTTLKAHLGPEFLSERAGPGGRKVPYLEGWRVVENANDIFQFNGWSSEIKSQKIDFIDSSDGRHSVGVSSIIRITLQDGTFREDVGVGLSENSRSKGDAIEKAKKSSVTDGIKRALRLFGNVMGLSLSSKDYIKNIRKIPNPSSKPFHSDNLHRHPEYFVRSKSELPPSIDTRSIPPLIDNRSIPPSKTSNQPQNGNQRQSMQNLGKEIERKESNDKIQIPVKPMQQNPSFVEPLTDTDYLFNDDEDADFADINLENYEHVYGGETVSAHSVSHQIQKSEYSASVHFNSTKVTPAAQVIKANPSNVNAGKIVNVDKISNTYQVAAETPLLTSNNANIRFVPDFQKSSTYLGIDTPRLEHNRTSNLGTLKNSNVPYAQKKNFPQSVAPSVLSSGNLPPRKVSHGPLKVADNRPSSARKFDQILNNPSKNKRPYPEDHDPIF